MKLVEANVAFLNYEPYLKLQKVPLNYYYYTVVFTIITARA